MVENEPADDKVAGASGGDGGKTPQLSLTDGVMSVDGRKVVYESELIAAKKGLEGQLEKQQTAHVGAIDTAKLELSEAQQQVAQLNAKATELEQARESGAVTSEDAAKAQQELETAKTALEQSISQVLDLRRANIILASQGTVNEEQLKDKSLAQLDAFEEAFKAVTSSRGGIGPYVTGGGGGGATPETPMDRAARILEATPVRGVRNADNT